MNARWSLRLSMVAVLLLPPAGPAVGQLPESTHLSPERADALTGLYRMEDGRRVHVLDLRDQLQGRPVLSLLEYDTGRVRALYPSADGSFEAGNAWFQRDSVEYRVRFHEPTDTGVAPGFTWIEGGSSVEGRRAPLRVEEVTLERGDVTLRGSLVLPSGSGPHPAVIMVPGSGPLTRRAPRYVGDYLAAHGVAVLAMDKRGTGGSGGSWEGLSHEVWAGDVEAQLDLLLERPDIAPDHIGLHAASEGGYVAPVVAARRPEVGFLLCRVCAALPHDAVIRDMQAGSLEREGLTAEELDTARQLLGRAQRYAVDRTGYDSLVAMAARGRGRPWRRIFPVDPIPAADAPYWDRYAGLLRVDPVEHYRRLDIPVLVVLGEHDDRILVERNLPLFRELADASADFTVRVVPGANHGLLLTEEGRGAVRYPPGLHEEMARWIAGRAGLGSPVR